MYFVVFRASFLVHKCHLSMNLRGLLHRNKNFFNSSLELQHRALANRSGNRQRSGPNDSAAFELMDRLIMVLRWDDSQPELFEGQYGVYLMKKV